MNPHSNSKLNQRQKEQQAEIARAQNRQATSGSTAMEFASPEEMIRHDAAQTELPPGLAERLQESVRQEPPRPQGWWQRFFGGKK